jgi:septal ring factor EnvC (AmiA/AmiB activator)
MKNIDNMTLLFTIFSIILTALVGLAINLIKNTLVDIKKMNISFNTMSKEMNIFSAELKDIKDGMKEMNNIRIEIAKLQSKVEVHNENNIEIKTKLQNQEQQINKIKDDFILVLKETKTKN